MYPTGARSDPVPSRDAILVPTITDDASEVLQRQNEIDRALLRLQKECGIAFYRPHWYQHLYHRAPHKRRGLFAGNRLGKALVHGELVLTIDGFRRIETLQYGDIVFDQDGSPCAVNGIFPQGLKPSYKVSFDDNTDLDVCEDHLWLCQGPTQRWRTKEWVTKSTKQIIEHVGLEPKHAKQRYAIPTTLPVQFPKREVPLDPYLLGCLLGDGSLTSSGLRLTSGDHEIVDRCEKALPAGTKLVTDGYTHRLVGEQIHNRGGTTSLLPDILKNLGLYGRTSYTKFIPSLYLSNDDETRKALLQGLLDTDGYVKEAVCEYTSCSEKLAHAVIFLVQSLGGKAVVNLRSTKDQNGTECWSYRVHIWSPQSWMFHLSRKQKACNNSETLKGRVIYKIEPLGQRECTCISVTSPTRTFLARGCIVTHNSAANCAETVAWMLGKRPWYEVPFDILGVDHDLGKSRLQVVKESHPGGRDHPLVRANIPPWPTKQIVVCTNWDKVHEIWTSQEADRPGKLWQFLPRGFVRKTVRNHEGVIDEVYGTNGSLLKFMSVDAFKRNKLIAESSDWDRVSIDEPAPIQLWKGLARGLVDRNGQGDFTLTSLEEVWIYDYFNLADLPPGLPSESLDRFSLRATIWDNPYLTDTAISRYEAELDSDERECRLQGVPLELSGLIYKEFRRDTHVITSVPDGWRDYHLPANGLDPRTGGPFLGPDGRPDITAPRCILYARIDTHPVKPNAVQFAAVGPLEVPIICHEIYRACDADTLCESITEYVKLTGCFLAGIKLEPAAWIKDPSTRAVSIADRFAAHGLFVRPASKDLDNGILLTKSALKRRRILFTPNCKRTLWEFSRYRYNPETGKPVDSEDHMMENLRRFCIDRLPFFDPDRSAGEPIRDMPFESADLSPLY